MSGCRAQSRAGGGEAACSPSWPTAPHREWMGSAELSGDSHGAQGNGTELCRAGRQRGLGEGPALGPCQQDTPDPQPSCVRTHLWGSKMGFPWKPEPWFAAHRAGRPKANVWRGGRQSVAGSRPCLGTLTPGAGGRVPELAHQPCSWLTRRIN